MHRYYDYKREELLQNPKIPLEVMDSPETVFRTMADEMVQLILKKAAMGEPCVMICPVGPVGQYPYFVARVNSEGVGLGHVWIINMDEYLTDALEWVPKEHPLSFRGYMEREVYGRISPDCNVPPEQRVFPDPKNPQAIPALIARLGGVDAVFGGIGLNGHIAFNEPQPELTDEAFLQLETRVLPIAPETRACNAIGDFFGRLEDMPRHCVTVGMREIMSARMIRLGVFRGWHGAVVRRAAHGAYSAEFPVTLLQKHPNTLLRIPNAIV